MASRAQSDTWKVTTRDIETIVPADIVGILKQHDTAAITSLEIGPPVCDDIVLLGCEFSTRLYFV